uniref:Capsid protein n=1 Tax=Sweet potato chlorotic fleck virus TaxID=263004 RepID=K9J8U5_9VIRU|nr:coat protein [Sweet potato chlorotic fleck virus]
MFAGESQEQFKERLDKYNRIRREARDEGKSSSEVKALLDLEVEEDKKRFAHKEPTKNNSPQVFQSHILGAPMAAKEADTMDKVESSKGKEKAGGQTTTLEGLNEVKAAQGEISDQQLMRHDALIKWYMENYRPSDVVNPLMQSGDKHVTLSDNLKEDAANIYSRPNFNTLLKWNREPVSQSIATAEDIAQIEAMLVGLGIPQERVRTAILDIVLYAAHSSSSPQQLYEGDIDFRDANFKEAISRSSVAAVIKDKSTIRKVCRLFAPVVWSYMIINNEPPSGWQAKGFPENAKFAAFDTFDFVTNHAAIKPLEGIARPPNSVEYIAAQTSKRILIDKARRNEKLSNYEASVTGGQQACEIKTELKGNGKCK